MAFLAGRAVRRLAAPIGEVMEAADRVAGGDYATRVQVTGPGEVARLASSFNQMTERLQANEAQRRALLADVTHELRTPLSVIRGNIEGMLDGVYPPDEAHLGPVLEETAVMARLLDDLQTLSTAEAGVLRLHRERVDPAALAQDAAAAFRARADRSGVELECRAAGPVPEVDVDPVRIGEVLANLLTNAIRHTPRGGSVRVAVEAVPDGVAFTVSDTGPGSPPATAAVFGRFVKSADSGGRAGPGHRPKSGRGPRRPDHRRERSRAGDRDAVRGPGCGKLHRFVGVTSYPCLAPFGRAALMGRNGHPDRSRRVGGLVTNGELGATGQKIYDFIRDSHAATGLVPTVREIREAIGVSSIGTVGYWLDKLEALNLIRRDAGKNRSIQLRAETPNVPVPLVGEIRAGSPILADERVDGNFVLPRQLVGEGRCSCSGARRLDDRRPDRRQRLRGRPGAARRPERRHRRRPGPGIEDGATVKHFSRKGDRSACSRPTRPTSPSRSARTAASSGRWSPSCDGSEHGGTEHDAVTLSRRVQARVRT